MRYISTPNRFSPELKTGFTKTHASSPHHKETELEVPDNKIAYQFLIHPEKNSLYAGEQISPQAPGLQLPMLLHPDDAVKIFELLSQKGAARVFEPVCVQSRFQALDGTTWIACNITLTPLPSSYKELLGWHGVATLRAQDVPYSMGDKGEQVLHILSQLYNAGIWRFYPKEEQIELDSALQKLLNLDKRKLVSQEWLFYIHPDDKTTLLKKIFKLQRKGGSFQLNIRYRGPSSNFYRYLTLSAAAFLDSAAAYYLTGICFDSTHQQRLQSRNILNKTFLEEAQAIGNIGCFEWLADINKFSATAQLKKILGLTEEEDFSLEYLYSYIPPEDQILLNNVWEGFLAGNHIQEATIRFRSVSGTIKNLWISAKVLYDKGSMVSLIGVVQDITPLVEQQVQLQAKDKLIGGFLRNLPVCIMAVNKKLQIVSVIGAGLKMVGIERKNLIGNHLENLFPDFVAPVNKVFAGTPQSFVVEHVADNHILSLFNYYYLDTDRDLAIGFTLDISHQRQAEQTQAHLHQLEQRYQLMDTFVHAVAHDLRSPVVNLDMLLNFFKQDSSPEEQSKYVAAMSNGIQHLKRTLDALIEILRIEKDSNVATEEIKFEDLLHELEHEYGEKLKAANGVLHTYLQCESIRYNRAYLSSILRNLIGNAIKYQYPGRSPHINVCTEKKGDIVMLLVQDNGTGMDLNKWGHLLFRPFKRLNSHQKGTGIGLHLVKQIIEKNGGKIKVKSQPGIGTTFFCFLRPYK